MLKGDDELVKETLLYKHMQRFEKAGYISYSRTMGKTALYRLSKDHPHVKIWRKAFNDCLKLVWNEQEAKHKSGSARIAAPVSAKSL